MLVLLLAANVFAMSPCPYWAKLREMGWHPQEGHGPREGWDVDGPQRLDDDSLGSWGPVTGYPKAFRNVLAKTGTADSKDFFAKLLEARHTAGKPAHVLDLFGSGFFVPDPAKTASITGARWGNFDPEKLPADYPKDKIPKEVLGDLLHQKTWDKLDASMKERSIPKFDLITMNPVGGWRNLGFDQVSEAHALALAGILRQAHARLNEGGRMYFGIDTMSKGDLSKEKALQEVKAEIEKDGKFQLVLVPKMVGTTTFRLEGAILPK